MALEKKFIILLHALRHDFISEERTPFLFACKQRALKARVIETAALQTRPAYLAGLEPDQSNVCHPYEFNPQQSPFSFLRALKPLCALLDRLQFDRFVRSAVRKAAQRIERSRGHEAVARSMSTSMIPLTLLPYFSFCDTPAPDSPGTFSSCKTIFDHFRENGLSWNWLGHQRHLASIQSVLGQYAASPRADAACLHFSALERAGQAFGPQSPQMTKTLKQLDRSLQQLLERPLAAGAQAVIFGDHGLVEVNHRLDLLAELRGWGLRLGKDYVLFLDNTQARFWFLNARAREQIEARLREIKGGHILSAQELRDLHIHFTHTRFGELIFMLDGGWIIHPSFFDRMRTGPKGMHGYLPEVRDNASQVLALGAGVKARDLGTIPMTQIYNVILETLLGQQFQKA